MRCGRGSRTSQARVTPTLQHEYFYCQKRIHASGTCVEERVTPFKLASEALYCVQSTCCYFQQPYLRTHD